MNIFYLDRDPCRAAHFTCDKHVIKMILETAQLLSTAHHEFGSATENMYKSTHKNHPSSIWVRQNKEQYVWTYELFKYLSLEYNKRYNRDHKSWSKLQFDLQTAPSRMPNGEFTDPPQCMPDECKMNDTVEAYRKYYRHSKAAFAKWSYSPTPFWYTENERNLSPAA